MRETARRARAAVRATAAGKLRADVRWRHACASLLLVPALAGACGRGRDAAQVRTVDLLRQFKDAERRPAAATFEMGEHTFGGRSRASLIVPAESRVTFTLFIPHRARLQFYAGVPDARGPAAVAFRVGISDDRVYYTTLVEPTITSADTAARGWVPVAADLSLYAGRKLSLFYRPDERRWRIILGTHVLSGSPGVVYLGEPGIDTDLASAREYMQRLAAARR